MVILLNWKGIPMNRTKISLESLEALKAQTAREAQTLKHCLALDQFCFDLWKAIFRNRYGDILK